MNNELFVQNIKYYCKRIGVPPTTACKNAGVGTSFISDINRGQTPSVAKVQMLADYLGVTTSELLGETSPAGPGDKKTPATVSDGERNRNEVRIVGRDGTYVQRQVSDEQMTALKLMLEQLPEADDL